MFLMVPLVASLIIGADAANPPSMISAPAPSTGSTQSPSADAAQAPRPMTFLDLLALPGLSDPQLSPDGLTVAYVQDAPDWSQNKRIGHIWRIGIDGQHPEQLTRGERGESNPRWSPDGRTLAFLAKRGDEDDAQVQLLPMAGGEARALSAHVTAASAIQWSPDGRRVYFLADEAKTIEERARGRKKDDVFQYDEQFKQRQLWSIDVATGKETRLTTGESSVMSYRVSPDGARFVFERAPTPLLGDAEHGEVWTMAADGSGATALTSNGVAEEDASVSPDGTTILFRAASSATFDSYYQSAVFTVPVGGGAARLVAPKFPYEVQAASWADSQTVLLVANMGVHSEIFSIDLRHPDDPKQMTDGEHALDGWSYGASSGRHVFVLQEASRPGEIWTLITGRPQRVTDLFGDLTKRFRIARQERVSWKGQDGQSIEGLLFYPVDYVKGRRYPAIVQTHGGPASSDQFGWGGRLSYAQVLAGKNCFVFRPNYRGSTGYGNAFLRDMVGHYFRSAHLDVLSGVDWLVAQGLADPDRLIKMGWSAGGHMTNKVITFTNRFKAASSGAGAADWVSMYAQSDIRTYRTPWFGGTPWQAGAPIDNYWENSPLKYVSNVKTPTIFFVGQDDPRVPLPQSVEMFRALKSLGVPTHLYVAPREGHGWQELHHQLSKFNAEMAWFSHYALDIQFTPETAPESALKDLPRP
jgi:dipeptidyl aminopeptidase/acylaminoacyl peptidase